jgi:NADPH:quinone reductase-like Zn-dependent oxidoreductase
MMENYPNILGEDIAGEVVEVGEGVTRFKKGDRVISYVLSGGNHTSC